ncbi:MAG: TerD family protein [Patulibacter minatonensis]
MTISLTKGQKISLAKADGGALSRVRMGLGWDPIETKGMFGRTKTKGVDLDASALLLDADHNVVDTVWFRQLKSKDGSVTHTGDNLTGAGDGDDESIVVELGQVPASVETLVFIVTSFSNKGFGDVKNASCRLVDETSNDAEVARYDLSAQGDHTALVMSKVYRHGGEWKMAALGDRGTGRTVKDVIPLVLNVI